MLIKTLRFITILLVALLLGLAFAHVLERPAKMLYDAVFYITIQKTLFVDWGPPNIGGILEPSAIFATFFARVFPAQEETCVLAHPWRGFRTAACVSGRIFCFSGAGK